MTKKMYVYEDRPIKLGRRTLYIRVKKERLGRASNAVYTVRTQARGKGKPLYRTQCVLEPLSIMNALVRIQKKIGRFYFIYYIPSDDEIYRFREEHEAGVKQLETMNEK